MTGAFFPCPSPWEYLLPEGIEHLHRPAQAASRRWDLLALTPQGCRALPRAGIRARILLLPGECTMRGVRAETVVTCGLSVRDSITLSGVAEPVLCVQRTLPLLCGGTAEAQEFPLSGVADAVEMLPFLAARLLWTGSPYVP